MDMPPTEDRHPPCVPLAAAHKLTTKMIDTLLRCADATYRDALRDSERGAIEEARQRLRLMRTALAERNTP